MNTQLEGTTHFLFLPFELRRQILLEAIVAELKYSTQDESRRCSSAEEPLVHLVTRTSNLSSFNASACHGSTFWGREPMTRLMRTNRQIYEESFELIWSAFPICLPSNHPKAHSNWMAWLRAHNPRAIQVIHHLQIRTVQVIEWQCGWFESMRGSLDEQELENIIAQTESYPNLRKADLVVTFVGATGRESEAAKEKCRIRIAKMLDACQGRGIETLLGPGDGEDCVLGKEILGMVEVPYQEIHLNTDYHFLSHPITRRLVFKRVE